MAIEEFSGDYRFLSNFWLCRIEFNKYKFASVEHAYQAAKSPHKEHWAMFSISGSVTKPSEAKRLGRQLRLRDDWETVKIAIMKQLLEQKFPAERNHHLSKMLDATNNHLLVEGNTWGDKFWGKCDGEGRNVLGKLLMKIREKNRLVVRASATTPLIEALKKAKTEHWEYELSDELKGLL